jgi:hypothetical protein
MSSSLQTKNLLALCHALAGFMSMFIAGTYLFSVGDNVFDPGPKGIVPVYGIAMMVGIYTFNALACFAVAYSLWAVKGRLLVYFYDGFVFPLFLALLTTSMLVPTVYLTSSILAFIFLVLLMCIISILVCFQTSKSSVEKA